MKHDAVMAKELQESKKERLQLVLKSMDIIGSKFAETYAAIAKSISDEQRQ